MRLPGRIARLVLAGATVATLAGSVPASANDRDVIAGGSCSGRSDWKLKLSPQDGRIEVEYEVDSNVVGQRWRVRIAHDGVVIFRDVRITKAPSGSFTVRLLTRNHVGTDGFRARARNLATDELCAGGALF
jgi:hypothetical protein